MAVIRIGIVGLGAVAEAHLKAFELLDTVDIVSVCDIDRARAEAVASKYGAAAYSDHRKLLEKGGVDLVLVLTPAASHRAVVEAVASVGIHVFCEKPLALSVADGEVMLLACEDASVKFFYGSSYRYLPAFAKAKEVIQQGAIGDVMLMSEKVVGGAGLDAYRELPPAHYPSGGPGGPGMGLVDHGVHLIDIFSWFAESEITSVTGRGQISGQPARAEYMAMEFASGAIGCLVYNAATFSSALPNEGMFSGGQGWLPDGSLSEAGHWENEPGSISVHGTKGTLRVFHYANKLFLRTAEGLREIPLSGRPAFGHFATQLEACARAVLRDEEPAVGGHEAMRALQALHRVYHLTDAKP